MSTAYVRPTRDTVIEYDEQRVVSQTYNLVRVAARITEINARLDAIPADPTDAELLAWARVHYPMTDYSAERDALTAEKTKLTEIMAVPQVR